VHTRKNSSNAQNTTPSKYDRKYDEVMSRSPAGKSSGANYRGNAEDYNMRDDRSEASTVISTLSSTGYVCPKCYNKHLAGSRNAMCSAMREQDRHHENKITDMHMKYLEEQEAQKRQEKAKRIQNTKEMQKKIDADYEARREQRRSPPKEKDTSFKNLFDRQEEMRQKQQMLKQAFGTHIKEQIKRNENGKEKEKQANSQIYDTSLKVGNGYHNKYLDDPASVKRTLQNQVEEKLIKQNREKQLDKQAAQERHTQAMQQHQEEQQKAKMKEWLQQKELREAFARDAERKQIQQRDTAMNKSEERITVDQGYNQYKKRQQEEEVKTKKQLFDFRQYLLNQQDKTSYKQKYDERKQQKEVTSFDPAKKVKKVYPCGECSDPYEKVHLTKMH